MDFVPCISACANDLIQKLLVDLLGYPVDANADADLTGSQIHRLHSG